MSWLQMALLNAAKEAETELPGWALAMEASMVNGQMQTAQSDKLDLNFLLGESLPTQTKTVSAI